MPPNVDGMFGHGVLLAPAVGESLSFTDGDSKLLHGSQSAQSLSLSVSGKATNGYRVAVIAAAHGATIRWP